MMGIIVNTRNRQEYDDKINYYQMKGFKIESNTSANLQSRLTKKNLGPVWVHIILIISLIASILYLTELVLYPLAISDLFIRLNWFSLILAIRYLQYVGIVFLIIFMIMLLIILYYYLTKPYEVIIRLNETNQNINYDNLKFNSNRW